MPKKSDKVQDSPSKLKKDQVTGAQRELLEQIFDDHYKYRWKIYQINFFRGIFFGLGSVLGATVVVGVVLWLLSIFTDVPVVGDLFEQTQTTIEKKTD